VLTICLACDFQVLDLSFNGIGDNHAEALQQLFRSNTSLVHLDISNNHMTRKSVEVISQGLNVNRTMRGIHVSGK